MDYLRQELLRKGVTLQLLWHEYRRANRKGYQHSLSCHLYRQWEKKLDVTLGQEHRAGEKLFVDYAGQTVPVINPATSNSSHNVALDLKGEAIGNSASKTYRLF